MYISQRGKDYRKEVGVIVLRERANQHLTCRLACRITVHPPDARKRDLDNLPKAILDSLQHAGVYEDDEQIDDLHILRKTPLKGGAILIQLEECPVLYGYEPTQEEFLV